MTDHRMRIVAAVILAVFAVLESLASQGILDPEIASTITQVAIILLPVLGLGAVADSLAVEKRRRDPAVPALRDDIRDGGSS